MAVKSIEVKLTLVIEVRDKEILTGVKKRTNTVLRPGYEFTLADVAEQMKVAVKQIQAPPGERETGEGEGQ